jgi:uncharacterized protein (TIGR02186 family)
VLDGVNAADADARATEADLDAARLSVASQTARTWFDLLEARDLLALAEEDLRYQEDVLDKTEQRFARGLVELRRRQGLYQENPGGVSISEKVLYQARIDLPSNVTTGRYTAETFAIARGQVLASATARIEVVKAGLEGRVVSAAQRWSFLYGLGAIALSLGMGLLEGRLFARA